MTIQRLETIVRHRHRVGCFGCVVIALGGCGRIAFEPRSDGATSDAIAFNCPPTYMLGPTGCYRHVVMLATAMAAEADCEKDASGAHLAVVESAQENDYLLTLATSNAYIGLVGDTQMPVQWRWITGAAAPLQPWASGEPNNGTQCAELNAPAEASWDDRDCAAQLTEYLCESDGQSAVLAIP